MSTPDSIASAVGTVVSSAVPGVGLATAAIDAFGNVIKLTAQELAVLNSPQNQQARLNAAMQARLDQNAKDADQALATGKLDNVEKDLSL